MVRANVIQLDPQSVSAFGFQTTGVINPVANYAVGSQQWQTTTDPLAFDSASTLQSEGLTNPFLQALSNGIFSSWTFNYNTAITLADNSFQVGTYDAQGPPPPPSNNAALPGQCTSVNTCVGSEFFLNYVPTGNDPTTNIHWVQIVFANYTPSGRIPSPAYTLDVADNLKIGTVAITPYYDAEFAANTTSFLDIPFITGADQATDFDALTLLVSGPSSSAFTAGPVTIYGGVEWGWSNQVAPGPNSVAATPEPSSVAFLVPILLALAQLIRVRTRRLQGANCLASPGSGRA